jgi:hypothetical protein
METAKNSHLTAYQFKPGECGNPNGRPVETPEQKLVKKAAKQIIAEYKQALAEALPMIQPVLIAKALEGDIPAIKEVHDRAMDKAKQATDITSGGESISPVLIKFLDGDNKLQNNRDTNRV